MPAFPPYLIAAFENIIKNSRKEEKRTKRKKEKK
jgi:hypothetical protein